ncbi:MAG: class I SAM-dependent methyltransferase [Kofleriaceae bacterium]
MHTAELSQRIQRLARRTLDALPPIDPACAVARTALVRPIDYMRWAEFEAVLRTLALQPGERVLDVGSPQWLTLSLAEAHPQTEFVYTNIIERELAPFRAIADALGLSNVTYRLEDARDLTFATAAFDHVVTVSVIEHIYPEVGGDVAALRELGRVMRDGGRLHLTMPFKDRRNVIYLDGAVYERSGDGKQFFAREYDREQFDALIASSGFALDGPANLITERLGWFALDAYTWGPRSNRITRAAFGVAQLVAERVLRRSFEAMLADRYLSASPTADGRLVNIAVVLKKQGRG